MRKFLNLTVVGLLAAGTCAGCGSFGSLTYAGTKIVDEERTLRDADAIFRDLLQQSKDPVSLAEDSGCFLQVDDDREVQSGAWCGPMRGPEDVKSEWLMIRLTPVPSTEEPSKVTLVTPSADTDALTWLDSLTSGVPDEDLTLIGKEGREGDPKAQAPEPPIPVEEAGKVLTFSNQAEQAQKQRHPTVRLAVPGRTMALKVDSISERLQTADKQWFKPPKDGGFITLTLTEKTVDNENAKPDLSWSVHSGGKVIPLPVSLDEPMSTDAMFTVVVPKLKDATLHVKAAGVDQVFDLNTGKRATGGQAEPFYLSNIHGAASCPEDPEVGTEGEGAWAETRCQVSVQRSAYEPNVKVWAPTGKMYVFAEIDLSQASVDWAQPGKYANYTTKVKSVTGVTLDGVPAKEFGVTPGTRETKFGAWFEVPMSDAVTSTLSYEVTLEGKVHSFPSEEAPKTLRNTVKTKLQIPMRPSSY